MQTTERWLPVPGYEGLYEISDMGRVRSRRRRGSVGGIIAQFDNGHGYPRLKLCKDAIQRTWLVHQLVALAFIGPCPPGEEVRHLNDKHGDARAVNLTYGTRSQNRLDAVRNGVDPNASKTHCKRGHEFTPENTLKQGAAAGGGRSCRECSHIHEQNYRARRPAASAVKKSFVESCGTT